MKGGGVGVGVGELEARRLRGLVEQERDRAQRETGDRMIGWGHMTEALIPFSGFPLLGFSGLTGLDFQFGQGSADEFGDRMIG